MSKYHTSGPVLVRVTNGALPLVLAAFLIRLTLFVWFVYFLIKIAAHVGAWPF